MKTSRYSLYGTVLGLALLGGCATKAPAYDYSAFIRAKPVTLLVLPPVNESPEVNATPGVWAHATRPLAEAGYYVLPITLVDETFRQNGVTTANEVQEISVQKLRDYFGADAAVYLKVRKYGTSYAQCIRIVGRAAAAKSRRSAWLAGDRGCEAKRWHGQ